MKRAPMWKMLPLLILIPVSGCVNGTGAKTDCAGWEKIVLDDASIDGLTDRDARAVLAHNEFGDRMGCW